MDLGPDVKSSSKRSYERFLAKAEGYLHKYQAMHSSSASATASGSSAVTSTGRGDTSGGSRHIEFLKKAQDHLNKKDNKNKKDVEDNADFDGQHDYKKLAHAMLKKIKKHKGRHNNGHQGSNNEEQHAEDEDEIEEQHAEDEDEGCWFTQLLEGIQEAFEE